MKKLILSLIAMVILACGTHNPVIPVPQEVDMGTIEMITPVYGEDGNFNDLQIELTHDTILVALTDVQELVKDPEWKAAFQKKKYRLVNDGNGNAYIQGSTLKLKFKGAKVVEVRE